MNPKINQNGVTREMTDEEYAIYCAELAAQAARERVRALTTMEKLEAQITYTAMVTDTLLEV